MAKRESVFGFPFCSGQKIPDKMPGGKGRIDEKVYQKREVNHRVARNGIQKIQKVEETIC